MFEGAQLIMAKTAWLQEHEAVGKQKVGRKWGKTIES